MVLERTSRLEGAYEQADRRMEALERRADLLQQSMEALRAGMNSRFNTLYVLLCGSWVTIIAAIIGLYLKG